MNQLDTLIHRLFLITLLSLYVSNSFAFDFVQDGIFYSIMNQEAQVTYNTEYAYNSYSGDIIIPNTVTYLGINYAVTSIGEHAFSKCVGLNKVTIPNSIKSIEECAFEGCSWLTSVTIPSSVSLIKSRAFANCPSLTSIKVVSGNSTYDSRGNCNAIIETASNQMITGCLTTEIPNSVTSIGEYAFEGCVRRTQLTIPNAVVRIDNYAFHDCLTLTNVYFGSNLREIGDYAFNGCYKMKDASLPNHLTDIGSCAFMDCYELSSVSFGHSLLNIGNSAFMGCSKLTDLTIPSSVSQIGTYAFSSCPNIASIQVEEGNSIYDSRNNCNAIIEKTSNQLVVGCQNTIIPISVKIIGLAAFYGCSRMTSITIPNSVNVIHDYAFSGCSNLADLFSNITRFSSFSYGSDLFNGIAKSTCVLHVPKGTIRMYKSLSQWRDFMIIEEMNSSTDVNGDDEVNIADINYIIDLILSGAYDPNADVNADGELNIADVNAVIDRILSGAENYSSEYGQYCLNNIYRLMHTAGWSTTGNTHQCFGISAYNLMAEVMGDDFIMGAQGSGWFWFDAAYNVKGRYTSSAWRSYDLWNAYFTWIANANEIIGFEDLLTSSEAKYILGQAYSIRAYSYFMLAQSFARTYKGHANDLCVPLFTGTVFTGSTGQSRATIAQVYAQIDADINKAISLLTGTKQKQPEHMGLAVALGLQARIALVKEDWNTALNAAEAAIDASGCEILDVPSFLGLNNATSQNVMWGAQIPEEEVGMYASFFAHLSTDVAYGQRAPKQISPILYNKINSTDARRVWWDPNDPYYSTGGYVQKKFDFSNFQTWEGDYIWMRIEEMYLTAAEAACRLGIETTSKRYLMQLMNKRDPYYTCNKTGTRLGTLTNDETGSLLEEILLQRRIELWGEDGRIYTIRRLRQGFERTSARGWPNGLLIPTHAYAAKDPESYLWVLTIPQAEFDGNPNMNPSPIPMGDQNPIGDYPE